MKERKERNNISRIGFVEFYNWAKTLENPELQSISFYKQKLESICKKEFVELTVRRLIIDCGIKLYSRNTKSIKAPLVNRVEELEVEVKRLQDQINRLESMLN